MQPTDPVQHQRDLQATLAQILALIEKQEVVSGLVERQETPRRELVQTLLARQQSVELRRALKLLHPADIAFVLENLPPARRSMVWNLLDERERGAALIELAGAVRESLLAELAEQEIVSIAATLDVAQIAELMPDLDPELAARVLNALDSDERRDVQSVLSFPKGSVGALMDVAIVKLRDDQDLGAALEQLRGRPALPANLDQVFIVDGRGVLAGALSLRDLLVNRPQAALQEVMRRDVVAFNTDDSLREAAGAFERYNLLSAPVVNLHGQPVGMLTVDKILDYREQQVQRERLNQVGLREDEDLFAPVWESARNRWLWLGVNLGTALVATRIIGLFEDSIVQIVALASLMPIVASIGGNTGNQTVALMIRGIAMRQITKENRRRFLAKEGAIGLVNGLMWGGIMAVVVFVLYGDAGLALVMMLAMAANLLVAACAGTWVPAALEDRGRDPVLGSSVMLTALTDSMGFFIFLGLATLILL
jgi:magnesium transporter